MSLRIDFEIKHTYCRAKAGTAQCMLKEVFDTFVIGQNILKHVLNYNAPNEMAQKPSKTC